MKLFNFVVGTMIAICFVVGARSRINQPVTPSGDEWFENAVTKSSRPVLVKFGADWCGPCRHMEKVLDDLESKVAGKVKIVRINVDDKPQLAAHYGVSAIPRFFVIKDGKVVASRVGGFADAQQTKSWLDQQL